MRGRIALAATVVGALVFAAPAGAAIVTETQLHVSSPAGTYLINDELAPSTISGTGTSNGNASNHVDIKCFSGKNVSTLEKEVAVAANGTFTFEAPLARNQRRNLRAARRGPSRRDGLPAGQPLRLRRADARDRRTLRQVRRKRPEQRAAKRLLHLRLAAARRLRLRLARWLHDRRQLRVRREHVRKAHARLLQRLVQPPERRAQIHGLRRTHALRAAGGRRTRPTSPRGSGPSAPSPKKRAASPRSPSGTRWTRRRAIW